MLQRTYADASYDRTWDTLLVMCSLFERAAAPVAAQFGFDYPRGDAERVRAHLKHVRYLPSDAREIC